MSTAKWEGPKISAPGPYHDIYDLLLELLRNKDEDARLEVVKALGRHIGEPRVEREIRDILNNDKESLLVRREALLGLWGLFSRVDIHREIIGASNMGSPVELRIAAYKSFSRIVCDDAEVRMLVHSALEDNDVAIRQAAVWALWTDTANPLTRQHLLAIARDSRNSPQLRVEAVRSLIDAIGDWEVQRLMLELAEQQQTDARIREAATLGLSSFSQDWVVRRTLRKIADDSQPSVSLAAIRALGGPTLRTSRYFEHLIE